MRLCPPTSSLPEVNKIKKKLFRFVFARRLPWQNLFQLWVITHMAGLDDPSPYSIFIIPSARAVCPHVKRAWNEHAYHYFRLAFQSVKCGRKDISPAIINLFVYFAISLFFSTWWLDRHPTLFKWDIKSHPSGREGINWNELIAFSSFSESGYFTAVGEWGNTCSEQKKWSGLVPDHVFPRHLAGYLPMDWFSWSALRCEHPSLPGGRLDDGFHEQPPKSQSNSNISNDGHSFSLAEIVPPSICSTTWIMNFWAHRSMMKHLLNNEQHSFLFRMRLVRIVAPQKGTGEGSELVTQYHDTADL